ncbi:MAG: GAF domain-containing protein [Parvimonas sp.]|nr:GAF domain-containing protein [Parvimonas sp.]
MKDLYELCNNEENIIANLSNASALLNFFLEKINWVGFYILDEKTETLVLGPFQGLPACVRIQNGKGVCGTSASLKKTLNIENVHNFEGHIACDSKSNSEIVIPIFKDNKLFGVLDIDSPIFNRFSNEEQIFLEAFVKQLEKHI